MSSGSEFFNKQNETMLDRILFSDFQRRTNNELNEKQKERLVKTVRHYMEEVHENKSGSLQELNKEVLGLVVQDFTSYLRRQTISATSDTDTRMKEDIGSRFASLQNERVEQKVLMPPVPDFRIPMEEGNNATAVSLFEKAKKRREEEAKRLADSEKPSFSGTFLTDLDVVSTLIPSGVGNANPTIAKPEAIRIKPILQQDMIIPQDDILSYKENEYNLIVYSVDRDWYNNVKENRYNFSVTFNPANNGQGFKYSPSANMKFHNIVRIEMVKAIVPNESIDTLITNIDSSENFVAATNTSLNMLTLPGILLRIDELDTNTFGTDDHIDRAFASLQYDAQWLSDSSTNNPGYLAMIPKFLKCQKVYYPTPLATLTKLTIQLQRPNGNLVSESSDTLDISGIFASTDITGYSTNSLYAGDFIEDACGNAVYYILVTKQYFNRFAFSKNDRIQIQGINTALISNNDNAKTDFANYLQGTNGLLIVGTGYTDVDVFTDGPNSVGYCNFIVLQAPYKDPTTGSVLVQPFGGNTGFNQTLASSINGINFVGARLINLTKQTQLTLRIITRDMDSATRIRANNA